MPTSTVALGGNAFLTTLPVGAVESISDAGLGNWTNANTICSTYFRMASAGSVNVGLNAYLEGCTASTTRVIINGKMFTVQLAGTTPKTYPVGTVNVAAPGYVKVDLQGVSKNGGYLGDVSGLSVVTASAPWVPCRPHKAIMEKFRSPRYTHVRFRNPLFRFSDFLRLLFLSVLNNALADICSSFVALLGHTLLADFLMIIFDAILK